MGRQMVEAFLLQGANVSYSARNITHTEFNDVLETLPPTNKATALGTALDVSSKAALDEWVQASVKRFGGLDTVVANGMDGQLPWGNELLQCPKDHFQRLTAGLISLSNAHG